MVSSIQLEPATGFQASTRMAELAIRSVPPSLFAQRAVNGYICPPPKPAARSEAPWAPWMKGSKAIASLTHTPHQDSVIERVRAFSNKDRRSSMDLKLLV